MEVPASMAVMEPHLIQEFDEFISTDVATQCSDWFRLKLDRDRLRTGLKCCNYGSIRY